MAVSTAAPLAATAAAAAPGLLSSLGPLLSSVVSNVGPEIITQAAVHIAPIILKIIGKHISSRWNSSAAEIGGSLVGGLGTYISSIFNGMTPDESVRAVDAVTKALHLSKRVAEQYVSEDGRNNGDVKRAYDIVIRGLSEAIRGALQGRPKEAINGVLTDMKYIMDDYTSIPVEERVGDLSNEARYLGRLYEGHGEIKYGGGDTGVKCYNTSWFFGKNVPIPKTGGGIGDIVANFTNSTNSIGNFTNSTNSTGHFMQYIPGTANSTSTDIPSLPLPEYKPPGLVGSILWSVLPQATPLIYGLASYIGTKTIRALKNHVSPGWQKTLTEVEDIFHRPDISQGIYNFTNGALSQLSAYHLDTMRQNAARQYYEQEVERVKQANKFIDDDNTARIEEAQRDYVDAVNEVRRANDELKKKYEAAERKRASDVEAIKQRNTNKQNAYDEKKKDWDDAKALIDKINDLREKNFSNQQDMEKWLADKNLSAERIRTVLSAFPKVVLSGPLAPLVAAKNMWEINQVLKKPAFQKVNFTDYLELKPRPTPPEKESEDLPKTEEPAYKPEPAGRKYVEKKPYISTPLPSADMFATPYSDRLRSSYGSMYSYPYYNYHGSILPVGNMDPSTLQTALSSLNHVQNPLATSTFVNPGPVGTSTPLNTIRVPAYEAPHLVVTQPLNFGPKNVEPPESTFDSAEEAMKVYSKATKRKRDKTKFKPEDYADINPNDIKSVLPPHMTGVNTGTQLRYEMPRNLMMSSSTPKKREPPNPLAKALTLFNQLLGFFSSSINLKSYAVHSAIKFSNPIYDIVNRYIAKISILLFAKVLKNNQNKEDSE